MLAFCDKCCASWNDHVSASVSISALYFRADMKDELIITVHLPNWNRQPRKYCISSNMLSSTYTRPTERLRAEYPRMLHYSIWNSFIAGNYSHVISSLMFQLRSWAICLRTLFSHKTLRWVMNKFLLFKLEDVKNIMWIKQRKKVA